MAQGWEEGAVLAQQARCQPALRTQRCSGREGTKQHLPNIALPSEQCGPAEHSILQLNIEHVGYTGHIGYIGVGVEQGRDCTGGEMSVEQQPQIPMLGREHSRHQGWS